MRHRRLLLFIITFISGCYAKTVYATEIVLPPRVWTTYVPLVSSEVHKSRHTLPIGLQLDETVHANSTDFSKLKKSQVNWVRIPIQWRDIEPIDTEAGEYRWSLLDQKVVAALEVGPHVIITHQSNPAWAASSLSGPIDIAPLEQAAEYLAALVERYDGDGVDDALSSPIVRHVELYEALDYGPQRAFEYLMSTC
ncbi:MAG: hypothetical protein AAF702_49050 [Chloroflexota bacterium]